MILPNLAVHCPTGLSFVTVNGGGNREVARVLLVVGPGGYQFYWLSPARLPGALGKNADVTEGEVAVVGAARPVAFH